MKRPVALLFSLLLLAIIADGVFVLRRPHSPAPKLAQTTAAPASKPTASPDPLTIAAIRARHYKGSPIEQAQDLGAQNGYRESVVSFTSDGLTEYALQARPDAPTPAGGYPVIILLHGYFPPPQYQTTGNYYQDFYAAWAKAGFLVLRPDYRGNGQSQGQAVSGHYSADYTYDILNLIASLKQYNLANPKRIGLAGHSMGGHEALRVAVSSPDIKATVIANGVVGSFFDLFYNWPHSPAPNDQPLPVVTSERTALIAAHGTPQSNPKFYDSISAINFVDAIRGPIQIHQDAGDSTVPKLFADNLNSALQAAHKPVAYNIYPGDDHQLAAPQTRISVVQRTTDFFKQYL
jgi:dipeptidyl aminopeptidase/acylaminoacyl peptidase